MEVWKDIIGFKSYQVSNLGNVKSLNYHRCGKEKILKLNSDGRGYLNVDLCNNGISKTFKIHQLVAIAFLDHKPNGKTLVVNHINFNRTDNRVENLEIVTMRENGNKKHIKSSSQYTGVSWCKRSKKWRSSIDINGKKKHLGYFNTEIEAHNAYQNKLITTK